MPGIDNQLPASYLYRRESSSDKNYLLVTEQQGTFAKVSTFNETKIIVGNIIEFYSFGAGEPKVINKGFVTSVREGSVDITLSTNTPVKRGLVIHILKPEPPPFYYLNTFLNRGELSVVCKVNEHKAGELSWTLYYSPFSSSSNQAASPSTLIVSGHDYSTFGVCFSPASGSLLWPAGIYKIVVSSPNSINRSHTWTVNTKVPRLTRGEILDGMAPLLMY